MVTVLGVRANTECVNSNGLSFSIVAVKTYRTSLHLMTPTRALQQ